MSITFCITKSHNPGSITTNDCGSNPHYLSVSSPLLLRITPHTFDFIPILPMCLSSLNSSIYKAFRHIIPCLAPLYKGMIYSKTDLPWQMNKTLIINFSYHKKPRKAVFGGILPTCFFFSLLVN